MITLNLKYEVCSVRYRLRRSALLLIALSLAFFVPHSSFAVELTLGETLPSFAIWKPESATWKVLPVSEDLADHLRQFRSIELVFDHRSRIILFGKTPSTAVPVPRHPTTLVPYAMNVESGESMPLSAKSSPKPGDNWFVVNDPYQVIFWDNRCERSGERSQCQENVHFDLKDDRWLPLPKSPQSNIRISRGATFPDGFALIGETVSSGKNSGLYYRWGDADYRVLAEWITPRSSRVDTFLTFEEKLIVWASESELGCLSSGTALDLMSFQWREIGGPRQFENCRAPIVRAGSGRLLVWGGLVRDTTPPGRLSYVPTTKGEVYSFSTGAWATIPEKNGIALEPLGKDPLSSLRTYWDGRKLTVITFPKDDTARLSGVSHVFDVVENSWSAGPQIPCSADSRTIPNHGFFVSIRDDSGSEPIFSLALDPQTKQITHCAPIPAPPWGASGKATMIFGDSSHLIAIPR